MNPDTSSGPVFRTDTSGSPTFQVSDCPCDCGTCGEYTEDGAICQLCRVGLHEAEE